MNLRKCLMPVALVASLSACSHPKKSAPTEDTIKAYDTEEVTTTHDGHSKEGKMVVEKDNTALNRNEGLTAQSQSKGTRGDVEVTRLLRKRLMEDDQLSTNAHNIKIITIENTITLRGPVANKEEKVKIENLARSVAGPKNIDNQLTY